MKSTANRSPIIPVGDIDKLTQEALNPSRGIAIMFARQRSGTNALRSILSTNKDIVCHGESFHSDGVDLWDSYFYLYLKLVKQDATHSLPGQKAGVFKKYLCFLQQNTNERINILDIKYDSAHNLNGYWHTSHSTHELYRISSTMGIKVIHLRRRNILLQHISYLLTGINKLWILTNENKRQNITTNIHLETEYLVNILSRLLDEERSVQRYFINSKHPHYLELFYEDIFDNNKCLFNRDILKTLADFLDVEDDFESQIAPKKILPNRPKDLIMNYDEVAETLAGTEFEKFLTE